MITYKHGRNWFEKYYPLASVRLIELAMARGKGYQKKLTLTQRRYSMGKGYPTEKWPSPYSGPTGIVEPIVVFVITLVRFFSLGSIITEDPLDIKRPYSKDLYITVSVAMLLWLLFDQSLLGLTDRWQSMDDLRLLVSGYIVVEAFVATLAVVFVNRYFPGREPQSSPRSIILLFVAYAQLAIGFAVWYCYFPCNMNIGELTPGKALYLSSATITTLGHAHIYPKGQPGQSLVILQVVSGVVLVGVILAHFVSIATTREENG